MVVKPQVDGAVTAAKFESCVVLDGSQTKKNPAIWFILFESCVVLDGSQTSAQLVQLPFEFESCVVLDGSQTINTGCFPFP